MVNGVGMFSCGKLSIFHYQTFLNKTLFIYEKLSRVIHY